MKTLREIYTDLVATHAANTPGEMVTTFSDKGSMHSYIEFYEQYFAPHREHASVLEIGVMTGGSLLLWQEYFDTVWLTGIDLREGFNLELPFQTEIVARFHWGVDSTDSAQVPDLPEYQFVIDDGAHDLKSQIQTLKNYWHLVRPGGTYFIEDIEDDISVEILQCFVQSWITTPHTTEHYRGFEHRADDQILAITKEHK
jgi:hypothetical protein